MDWLLWGLTFRDSFDSVYSDAYAGRPEQLSDESERLLQESHSFEERPHQESQPVRERPHQESHSFPEHAHQGTRPVPERPHENTQSGAEEPYQESHSFQGRPHQGNHPESNSSPERPHQGTRPTPERPHQDTHPVPEQPQQESHSSPERPHQGTRPTPERPNVWVPPLPEVESPPLQDGHHTTYTTANHSVPAVTHFNPSHRDDIRLLIGVMSPFASSARRQMIRHAYGHYTHLPVDIVFVQANVPTSNPNNAQRVLEGQRNITIWENSTFGDIMHLDCEDVVEDGISYDFFRKVGLDFTTRYTHVMKTDEDTFINIPGTIPTPQSPYFRLTPVALVQVLQPIKDQTRLYWGTTWIDELRLPRERRGSTYILSMDQVAWLATSSDIPHQPSGNQDAHIVEWLRRANRFGSDVVNRTAFAGYPWPELGDRAYNQENVVRPYDRWTIVTSPLREAFMWVETAQYYLGLDW